MKRFLSIELDTSIGDTDNALTELVSIIQKLFFPGLGNLVLTISFERFNLNNSVQFFK